MVARLLASLMVALAGLALASCDGLAAGPPDSPTHRFTIQTDLDELRAREGEDADIAALMQQAAQVITRRVEGIGGYVHAISHDTDGSIVLETSGLENGRELAEMFGTEGELDLRMVDSSAPFSDLMNGIAPPGTEILPFFDEHGYPLAVRRLGGISGDTITSAAASRDSMTGEPVIAITLDQRGAQQLAQLSTDHVGEQMAVVFDGKIVMAPILQAPILGGQLQISGGDFTDESANRMAVMLRSGMLRTPFTLVAVEVLDPAN